MALAIDIFLSMMLFPYSVTPQRDLSCFGDADVISRCLLSGTRLLPISSPLPSCRFFGNIPSSTISSRLPPQMPSTMLSPRVRHLESSSLSRKTGQKSQHRWPPTKCTTCPYLIASITAERSNLHAVRHLLTALLEAPHTRTLHVRNLPTIP